MRARVRSIVVATGVVASGVLGASALSACTPCSSCGIARYSGDAAPARLANETAGTANGGVVRRNVPVWPSAPAQPAPSYATAPSRTVAPRPIALRIPTAPPDCLMKP